MIRSVEHYAHTTAELNQEGVVDLHGSTGSTLDDQNITSTASVEVTGDWRLDKDLTSVIEWWSREEQVDKAIVVDWIAGVLQLLDGVVAALRVAGASVEVQRAVATVAAFAGIDCSAWGLTLRDLEDWCWCCRRKTHCLEQGKAGKKSHGRGLEG